MIAPPATIALLLAAADAPASPQTARLQEISRHFSSGGSIAPHWLFIAGGLLLLIMAGVSLRTWYRNRHLHSSPLSVFNQVAAACQLSNRDRLLLWWIARRQNLPSPLTLMASPTTLRHHAELACQDRSRISKAHHLRRIARLRRQLFHESPTPR